jgi:branched-chain amino acid transport system substrate-binding protein
MKSYLMATSTVSPTVLPQPSEDTRPQLPGSAQPVQYTELERISGGEQVLFPELGQPVNLDFHKGVAAFRAQDWQNAIALLQKATQFEQQVKVNRNRSRSPEPEIYLQNARAQAKGNPLKLAVVVPVDQAMSSALEILRGVADAQARFNTSGGLNQRLLEIAIANDGNQPENASQIAHYLAQDSQILGVIGHNDSAATQAALPIYYQAGLAVVSPTSSSTELTVNQPGLSVASPSRSVTELAASGKSNFFRTIPSTDAMSRKLAEYVRKQKLTKVAVFATADSFGRDAQNHFGNYFANPGESLIDINMSEPKFNAAQQVDQVIKQGAKAAILFPDTGSVQTAIEVAQANFKLPQEKRLKLLGGYTLYHPELLMLKQGEIVNLVMTLPWFAELNQPFAQAAAKKWGGRVSYRTALSFDATQALIQAIANNSQSNQISRGQIIETLKTTNLSSQETSGEALQFTPKGDCDRSLRLFQIGQIAKSDKSFELNLKSIE